jgi:hypothetical protein
LNISVISLSCSPHLGQATATCAGRVSDMYSPREQAGACSTLSHRWMPGADRR